MLPHYMNKQFDVQYFQHVKRNFGTSLIGYWPLWEASGTVATDYSGQANNGTYSNVTLAQAGIGDGRTSASFNGTTSYCDIYSAGLASDFNGPAGTIACWVKMSAAGIWTDGLYHFFVHLLVDAQNEIYLRKNTTNNQIEANYYAGNVVKQVQTTYSATSLFHYAITWDKAADEVKVYLNGTQTGATLNSLGTWVGSLASTYCTIGAYDTTPILGHSGLLAHAALWTTPLTAQQIAELARISV